MSAARAKVVPRRIYAASYITGTEVPMDVRNAVHAEVGRIARAELA